MSQTKNVDLRKEVFNKPQYEQVIDTSFSQLGVQCREPIVISSTYHFY